ncbi:hypothetical protein PAXINDRAFT_172463 [Paxillus involutus ATCC 200175]|uniref:Uncharacterized protein n=1 Tax=Paxillus involutus ATCC 200175 TaxID=664439 RepID=A0A0C9TQS3_PAXIN|nr:hypothetical protein PAXINDRAFT_172463 [Paxillus involutus ATCC 200175]
MSLTWNLFEFLPIKHQVSWCGAGEHVRRWHLSKPRRIIPGQKIHASVLFANTYRPKAHLGEGFVFPAGWPSTSGDELDDEKWEKVLFDYTAVRELFGRLKSSRRASLRYLDRLLFVLRFKESRTCVRGEDKWQETFEQIIYGDSEDIVKLVAIVAYYEASVDEATVSKDVAKEVTSLKDTEVTSSKHVVNQVTLSEDVLKNARTCLQDILSRRSDRNYRRVIALLRPLTDHEALRKSILTADVITTFMGLLDQVLRFPGPTFSQTMDALGCLLKHEDLDIPLFERSRPLLMLAGQDRGRLTASLNVILPFARTERGRTDCKLLRPRLRHLAQNHQGRVGLLAVETLLELYESEDANTAAERRALTDRLHNDNFRANLAHLFNLLSGADDKHLSRKRDDHASNDVLRRLFGLGNGGQPLHPTQKELIRHLLLATADRDAPERTAATLTVLKLCEDPKIREHLLTQNITSAFIKQLKRRDTSLLGAHALTTCLQYDDMKQPILSNDKVLKYIVKMLRLDSFDDAVGQVEGWRVFAKLMKRLMQNDDLKRKTEGEGSEITKVLEEKLRRGKPKDIRTALISLEILRSIGEHPHTGDVWTTSLVEKGLAHLKTRQWKTQKAGITILSALAQTKHGVDAIMPYIETIVNMLLPASLQPKESTPVGSHLKPSRMLGPACALRVLSEDDTLRKMTNEMAQLENLKDLWLDGNLIEHDTARWRVKTPTRDDVLDMIDKMIKSVNGDFSEDLSITSVGRLALPEIQHWTRLAVLARDSVVNVIAPPARGTVKAVRYTAQWLSPRQLTYFLDRLQRMQSQHTG